MKNLLVTLILASILAASSCAPSGNKVLQDNNPCLSKCDAAGDELKNTNMIHEQTLDQQVMEKIHQDTTTYFFPLRIGIVQSIIDETTTIEAEVSQTINILNEAFRAAHIQFYIAQTDYIQSYLDIGLLQENAYEAYSAFSTRYDLQDTISLFLFDYDPDLCEVRDGYISCGRTGGFSYILSEVSNNVVLSKFDLEDYKIIVHEFGHFFGLYHTFEKDQFGAESTTGENCAETGDRICDTPTDPGTLYEVYVNYSKCEMIGHLDQKTGLYYQPLINNFMSYYKPCYLQKYTFTNEQLDVIKTASRSALRAKFRYKG